MFTDSRVFAGHRTNSGASLGPGKLLVFSTSREAQLLYKLNWQNTTVSGGVA